MDKNRDGVVTIEEFIETCQKVMVRDAFVSISYLALARVFICRAPIIHKALHNVRDRKIW